MGWCSGTEIFDTVVEYIIDHPSVSDGVKGTLLIRLINVLDSHDWDCHSDSLYWDRVLVRNAMAATGHLSQEDKLEMVRRELELAKKTAVPEERFAHINAALEMLE